MDDQSNLKESLLSIVVHHINPATGSLNVDGCVEQLEKFYDRVVHSHQAKERQNDQSWREAIAKEQRRTWNADPENAIIGFD